MSRTPVALVTGITGFIGSALGRRLSENGWHVIGLSRRPMMAQALPERPFPEMVVVKSYARYELTAALKNVCPDVVFHLAAAGVTQGDSASDVVTGNVDVVVNLIQAIADKPVRRFIHTGSCFEYGWGIHGVKISEETVPKPLSVYGAAKLASVHLARSIAAQRKMPLIVLRLFGVFGPGEKDHRLIPSLIRRLQSGEGLALTSGHQIRDLVFIDDVVEAFARCADANCSVADGIYNVCTGVATEIREVGRAVADTLGAPQALLRWGALAGRDDEADWIVGDNAKFCQATNWEPRWSLRRGVEETVSRTVQRVAA